MTSIDSVAEPAAFWRAVWELTGIVHDGEIRGVLDSLRVPGARWFEGVELSYAENLLGAAPERVAIIAECEDDARRRVISFGELRGLVARARRGLAALGVGPGDRVAALVPNIPDAVRVRARGP